MTFGGIILAAGRSRRAGAFKPAFLHRGKPLLAHAVDGMLSISGDLGPTVTLAVFTLFALLLTGFMSNAATAALLAPLAITAAVKMGVSPRPFLIALTFAASAAFYTPIG